MSPSRSPAPFVDTLDDVLEVVEAAVASHRRDPAGDRPGPFGAVALLLDGDDRLITGVACHGCDDPCRVVELCSVLLAAAPGAASWRSCVLVSDGGFPDPAEWRVLGEAFAGAGVELVDWLVVVPGLPLDPFGVRSASAEIDGMWPW